MSRFFQFLFYFAFIYLFAHLPFCCCFSSLPFSFFFSFFFNFLDAMTFIPFASQLTVESFHIFIDSLIRNLCKCIKSHSLLLLLLTRFPMLFDMHYAFTGIALPNTPRVYRLLSGYRVTYIHIPCTSRCTQKNISYKHLLVKKQQHCIPALISQH